MYQNTKNTKNTWHPADKKFIQPFNFVGLGKKCTRSNPTLQNGGLTGYIEYTLETITELIIPSGEMVAGTEVKSYKWNIVNGKYAIPGSSMRGLIRSSHEALKDSCVPANRIEPLFKRRTTKGALSPGLLRRVGSNYELYGAEKLYIVNQRTFKNQNSVSKAKHGFNDEWLNLGDEIVIHGQEVYFAENGQSIQQYQLDEVLNKSLSTRMNSSNDARGWICIANPIKRGNSPKHFAYVFKRKELKCEMVSSSSIDRYHTILDKYEANANGINPYPNNRLDGNKEYMPIWYDPTISNGEVYLCPAAIGIELFKSSFQDILGNYQQCSSEEALCSTCQLFGISMQEESGGVPGKVRFTDMIINGESSVSSTEIELASPHLSSIINYAHKEENPAEFISGYDGNVVFNGRKFYWHHKEAVKTRFGGKNGENRRTKVEVMPKNTSFSGRLYFENITEAELGDLLFCLQLTDRHAHKLGMGKPLGYGSVKLKVNQIMMRDIKIEEGKIIRSLYSKSQNDFTNSINVNADNVLDYLEITMLDAVDSNLIHYPIAYSNNDESKGFEWFKTVKERNYQQYAMFPTIRKVRNKKINSYVQLAPKKI